MAERLIRHARSFPVPPPWEKQPPWVQLLHDESPGGQERFHRSDVWHTFHMGIGKSWIASSASLVQYLTGESNVELRVEAMNEHFQDFCDTHGKVKYLKKLEPSTFGLKGTEPSGSWNKAHVTSTLMLWLESFMSQYNDICQEDDHLRFIVAWIFHHSFERLVWECLGVSSLIF